MAWQVCVFLEEEWMDHEENTHFKKRQSGRQEEKQN